jgi:hypothetical protein
MALRRNTSRPVDRAVDELDRQIAELQKQLRRLEHQPASDAGTDAPVNRTASLERVAGFIKNTMSPVKRPLVSRTRADLFDVGTEPLKELEADAVASARRPDADLFAHITGAGQGGALAAAPEATEKLTRYLSAGSIKTYKPLKHVQRRARNRFFVWLGLSFVAFWIIYVVVR